MNLFVLFVLPPLMMDAALATIFDGVKKFVDNTSCSKVLFGRPPLMMDAALATIFDGGQEIRRQYKL